jgi:hypothetical protein
MKFEVYITNDRLESFKNYTEVLACSWHEHGTFKLIVDLTDVDVRSDRDSGWIRIKRYSPSEKASKLK